MSERVMFASAGVAVVCLLVALLAAVIQGSLMASGVVPYAKPHPILWFALVAAAISVSVAGFIVAYKLIFE